MNRKDFLKLGTSAGVLAFSGALGSVFQSCNMNDGTMQSIVDGNEPFDRALPIIPILSGDNIDLTAGMYTAEVLKDIQSSIWGYNDSILGPAIKISQGATVNISVQNNLTQETTIHWHGLIVPADMDGHPQNPIAPGANYMYTFPILQRAGTYWFHPHPMGKTAEQVFMGLAGLFLVTNDEEALLNLPAGDREILLVLQDKKILSNGAFIYAPTLWDVMTGYMGDKVLVNGKENTYLNINRGWYRLRLVNGSNARAFNIAFSDNRDFYIIGNDAGLIAAAQMVQSVIFVSGERLDILVNFDDLSTGDKIYLKSLTFSGGGSAQGNYEFTFMEFKVNAESSDLFSLPVTLSSIALMNEGDATVTRTFDISNQTMDAGMHHTINGIIYDIDTIHFTVDKSATEIWEFDNTMGDEIHGMHVHNVQFQVLGRIGGRNEIQPWEFGWKDTVACFPGEKVKILIKFPEYYSGKYVMHCHNLEHEDSGMMQNFMLI